MSEKKYVVFQLDEELYGVPIDKVERILPQQSITPIPRTPKMLLGVFDIRGETIPAIDLRERFEMDANSSDHNQFIVVLQDTGRCAWQVDGVTGIFSFDETDIEDSPSLVKGVDDQFLAGVGRHNDRLVVMLDCDHVVPGEVTHTLAAAA